jgi:hypothetical protein
MASLTPRLTNSKNETIDLKNILIYGSEDAPTVYQIPALQSVKIRAQTPLVIAKTA